MLLALTLSVSGKSNLLQALAAGDSMSSATGISIGINYSGSITESNNKDFYRFEINSSGRVKLSAMAGIRGINYRIYDSAGNRVYSINPGWNSTTQIISTNDYADLTKGTYYFVVEMDYWGYTGNYSFKLDFTSANESFTEIGSGTDNTLFTANNILVNTKYNGQLANNDEKDFYRVTLPSSGRVVLTATAELKGIYYRVYDSEGNSLYSINPGWNSTTQLISTNDYIDLTKGTYYFIVEKDYWGYTGNYSFKLDFISANESFTETGRGTNNLLSSANSVTLNKQYYGQLAENDEKDFYKLTLNSTTQVSLTVSAGMKYIYYSIYDRSGNRLESGSGYWNDNTKKISISKKYQIKAGTYYIAFEKNSGCTGPYTFKLQTSSRSTVKKTPTIRVSKKTAAYRATRVRWASQSFKIGAKVSGNGKITYKKLSGSSKLVVASNGKVTVRKGTRRGTYRAIVQIRAAQSSKYKARTVKITVTVRVK